MTFNTFSAILQVWRIFDIQSGKRQQDPESPST